jgi:dTDP-4-amino-4,6-dideoxygalactose transaminase
MPAARYAWGTALDFSAGRALSAGEGGAAIHSDKPAFVNTFARHNCGRAPGEGSTLAMDATIGGNMRIAESQPALIEAGMDDLDKTLAERKERVLRVADELECEWLAPIPVVNGGVSTYTSAIFRYRKDKHGCMPTDGAVAELRALGYGACRPWRAMHRQPVFTSPYFIKSTGHSGGYADVGLENSIAAEESLIWVKYE